MRYLWLVLLTAISSLAGGASFDRGWPEGWQAPSDSGRWQFRDGRCDVTASSAASWATFPAGSLGPHARVTCQLRTPPDAAVRGLGFGLSVGGPEEMQHRACHLAFLPGRLAWFDGAGWRELSQVNPDAPLTVELLLDREHGQLAVGLSGPAAPREPHSVIPFWNQVGFPDTIFLNNFAPEQADAPGGAIREIGVERDPLLPAQPHVTLQRLGGDAVRVFWSGTPAAAGYRILRDGLELARVGPDQRVFVDRPVPPQTLVGYTIEAVDAGASRERRLVTGLPNEREKMAPGTYDAVVYGGTPGGIAAAVTLGRLGRKVALVEPSGTLGGMMTGGLSRTDFGSIHALGGAFKAFLDDSLGYYTKQYGADSIEVKLCRDGLYFEPQVARRVFLDWLRSVPSVEVMRECHLVGVEVVDREVRGVVLQDRRRAIRRTLKAAAFIDASYEGDLAAYAGASYLVGRESTEQFGEEHAGKLWWNVWERRVVEVVGTGDRKVQAYCYRLCLTKDVDNRLPPPEPVHYDRERYVGLLIDINKGRLTSLKAVLSILQLPRGKADANNHPQGDPSTDWVGGADSYPEADQATRDKLAAEHRDHILGLLWFLRFDEAVPEALRLDAQQWGLPRDEFPETEGWPSQLYVREGRRILGGMVFVEQDARSVGDSSRPPFQRDSIAVGAYPIDSHATGGRKPDEHDLLEGFFYLARGETRPYQIPYRVMLPNGLDRLLVCGCVSSTHVGYGTLRMEPVFMSLGLAAGLAADHALRENCGTREADLSRLQASLLASHQVLTVFEDVNPETTGWAGFNFWGTLGAFGDYHAQPDELLTAEALRDWLTRAPWPQWQRLVYRCPREGAVTVQQFARVLAPVGYGAQEQRDDRPLTRGEGMARLWELARARLRSH